MTRPRSTPLIGAVAAVAALVVGQGEASGLDAARPHVQVSADDFARLVGSVARDEKDLRKRLDELRSGGSRAAGEHLGDGRSGGHRGGPPQR